MAANRGTQPLVTKRKTKAKERRKASKARNGRGRERQGKAFNESPFGPVVVLTLFDRSLICSLFLPLVLLGGSFINRSAIVLIREWGISRHSAPCSSSPLFFLLPFLFFLPPSFEVPFLLLFRLRCFALRCIISRSAHFRHPLLSPPPSLPLSIFFCFFFSTLSRCFLPFGFYSQLSIDPISIFSHLSRFFFFSRSSFLFFQD